MAAPAADALGQDAAEQGQQRVLVGLGLAGQADDDVDADDAEAAEELEQERLQAAIGDGLACGAQLALYPFTSVNALSSKSAISSTDAQRRR